QHGATAFQRHVARHLGRFWVRIFSLRLLAGGVITESLSMSEEKVGQQYLAALHQAFPGVVLEESWQTKDQITVTIKVNYLPEVVEFLYYQQGGWLSV